MLTVGCESNDCWCYLISFSFFRLLFWERNEKNGRDLLCDRYPHQFDYYLTIGINCDDSICSQKCRIKRNGKSKNVENKKSMKEIIDTRVRIFGK